MAKNSLKPQHKIRLIRVPVAEDQQDLVKRFYTLCVVRGITRQEGILEAMENLLAIFGDKLKDKDWVDYDTLVERLKVEGFSLNRTTFWHHRNNKDTFADVEATDGTNILFEANAIIDHFRKEEAAKVAAA